MPGEPRSDSDHEWSEGGNTLDDSEDLDFLMDEDEDMEDQLTNDDPLLLTFSLSFCKKEGL